MKFYECRSLIAVTVSIVTMAMSQPYFYVHTSKFGLTV